MIAIELAKRLGIQYRTTPNGTKEMWCHERDLLAFAEAVMASERERCVRIIEAHRVPVYQSAAGEMAADWTMEALREVRDAVARPNVGGERQ